MLWILIILLSIGAIAAVSLGDAGTIGGLGADMIVAAVASTALLVFLWGGLGGYAGRFGQAIRDVAIWVGIALVLVLGYSFRDDLRPLYNRVAGELSPPGTGINLSTSDDSEQAVRIRKRNDGHFAVRAGINGSQINMLVDTGASTVVLTTDDARRVGINVDQLNFSIPVNTANGTGFTAAANIGGIVIGGIARSNIRVLVAKPEALRESLLGMNFLQLLRSYEFSAEYLTLRG